MWIKNLSRLLSSQLGKRYGKKYFCDRCLHYFHSEAKLEEHIENCVNQNDCKIPVPAPGLVKLKNFKNKIPAPFIIYSDLKCILVKVDEHQKYQNHEPCSIGYYVKCSYNDELSFYKSYRGENYVQWLTKEFGNFSINLESILNIPLSMNKLTRGQKLDFSKSKKCHICEEPFNDPENYKVRDHCHLAGQYRGAVHKNCNINFKVSHTVPIVFHNLSGYDSHCIIASIASGLPSTIDLLPINNEKYISFTKHMSESIIKFSFL